MSTIRRSQPVAINTNLATGVRYGIASLHSLEDDIWDIFLDEGTNVSQGEAFKEWRLDNPDTDEQEFYDFYESDDDTYELEYEKEGLKLAMSTLGGAYNVWVFESPHTTLCGMCSPCCPNAGDLNSEGNVLAYTLPADWFRTND